MQNKRPFLLHSQSTQRPQSCQSPHGPYTRCCFNNSSAAPHPARKLMAKSFSAPMKIIVGCGSFERYTTVLGIETRLAQSYRKLVEKLREMRLTGQHGSPDPPPAEECGHLQLRAAQRPGAAGHRQGRNRGLFPDSRASRSMASALRGADGKGDLCCQATRMGPSTACLFDVVAPFEKARFSLMMPDLILSSMS
jgi:hypothetical protein